MSKVDKRRKVGIRESELMVLLFRYKIQHKRIGELLGLNEATVRRTLYKMNLWRRGPYKDRIRWKTVLKRTEMNVRVPEVPPEY